MRKLKFGIDGRYANTSDILLTADGIIPIPVMLMVII